MKRICPQPRAWVAVHAQLRHAWERDRGSSDPPPVPLVLGGWTYSNDVEKLARWTETIEWAARNGYAALVADISEADWYAVDELSSYAIGPLGGPCYLPWSFELKTAPSHEACANALQSLNCTWKELVGPELAHRTAPLAFTGKKRRRLLVAADYNWMPPWGTWGELASGESRREFTRLRLSVNTLIQPLHVDHIDFVPARTPVDRSPPTTA